MNLRSLADRAKKAIDDRGGTERLKDEAGKLRDIASGPGTMKEKAKAAGEALRDDPATPPTHDDASDPPPSAPTGATPPPPPPPA